MSFMIRKFLNGKIYSINDTFLLIALLLYGLFSYSMPRNIGSVEIIIAILFIAYIGFGGLLKLLIILSKKNKNYIIKLFLLFFLFLLVVPTFVGMFKWDFADIFRDIVPLIYLFLPLFFYHAFLRSDFIYALPWLLSLIGLFFSLRYCYSIFISNEGFSGIKQYLLKEDLTWINIYDPSVIFSAMFLILNGIERLNKNLIVALFFMIFSLIPFFSLVALSLRAPIGLSFIALLLFLLLNKKTYRHYIFSLLISIMIYLFFLDSIYDLFQVFKNKHTLTGGASGKLIELSLIVDIVNNANLLQMIFGHGWGGTYVNEEISYERLSNTHSLFTYMLFKTGGLGLVITIIYFVLLFDFKQLYKSPLLISAFISLSIGILFQPTYKIFSYGLILSIVFFYKEMRRFNFTDNALHEKTI